MVKSVKGSRAAQIMRGLSSRMDNQDNFFSVTSEYLLDLGEIADVVVVCW